MSFRLAVWAGGSMVVALVVFALQPSIAAGAVRSVVQAIGAQCLLWGLIDSGFALFGLKQAQTADRTAMSPSTIARELSDRDKLERVLQFSAKLNLGMVAVAILLLAWGGGQRNFALLGHGAGVMIQAGFLFIFDRAFIRALR
jgi:hypothetical protein